MLDNLHCQSSLNSLLAQLEQVGGYKWTRYFEWLGRTDITWCDNYGQVRMSFPVSHGQNLQEHSLCLTKAKNVYMHCFFIKRSARSNIKQQVLWQTILGSSLSKRRKKGLPWWSNAWESTCKCQGHGFDPCSRKIPHAIWQRSLCVTTTEPTCGNYWSPHA